MHKKNELEATRAILEKTVDGKGLSDDKETILLASQLMDEEILKYYRQLKLLASDKNL